MMRPRIVLPSCSKQVGLFPNQAVQDKYVDAVVGAVGGFPVILPCPFVHDEEMIEQILAETDGVLLTGSPSNIEPHHYAGPVYEGTEYDPARDALTLALTRGAIDRRIPVFGICRGFQEMNVALGGSLHQLVHESGFNDHREPAGDPAVQYGPAHDIALTPGGKLATILGKLRTPVNSLHWQGVDRLATGCSVEAMAADGLVEALSVDRATAFALAVQWHPEWQWDSNVDSVKLFAAFGDAVRAKARTRR